MEEHLQLLDGTKLARKLKQPKYQVQLRKYGYRSNNGSGMQTSTTSEEGNSEVRDISGTSLQSEQLPPMEYYNDSSDGDFTASENKSESDEDINAVISFADENYSVDFPGKPQDFDEDMEAHIFHPCLSSILEKLQHSKYQAKWSTYDVRTLVDSYLMALDKLAKLKHPEMNIIQAEIYKYFGKKIFNVTSLKAVKVEQLAKQFCPHYINVAAVATMDCIRDSGFTDKMYTLKECARRCIMSSGYPKELLKIIVCQMTNDDDLREWLDASLVPCVIDIPEAGITHRIFCYPFFNEITHELECRSLDPSHILNNLRSQICRHGFTGISTKAFHDVSNVNNKIISKITLVDQMDKQKVSISKDFFSSEVEGILRKLGHKSEADFVELVRNWYLACDERGIKPLERLRNLNAMQSHLLSRFNYYNCYPPPTRYIQGITVHTFEAILITISTRFILYATCDLGHYNHHAISTLGIESFFSELTRMEFSGLGTPKSSDILKLISHIIQLNQVKHDPDRGFEFTLTKDSVYPYYLMDEVDEDAHPYFHNWFDEMRKRK